MIYGPSPNLSWEELACKDGTPYPIEWRKDRAIRLAVCFEAIRKGCGNRPITVISAYRTKTWNKRIGGANKSQHLEGRALDLRPPNILPIRSFYDLILYLTKYYPIRGIGLYRTFVHIDTRETPTGALVQWHGVGYKDDPPPEI
jgi:uncharacterized protein YcbK (DUF882 family)